MPLLTNQRSRLLGGGGLPVPVPVLGAELLTNGDLETWSSATNAGTWTEFVGGTCTITRQDVAPHGGTYCAEVAIDAANSAYFYQGGATAGTWYQVGIWAKRVSASAAMSFGKTGQTRAITLTSSWTYYPYVLWATDTQAWIVSKSGQNVTWAVDDMSVKPITLASMFSTRPYGTHVTVKAMATIVAGTRAGVVCNLDSASNPQNFVIGSHDGTTARLTKNVGGTYTELISTAVTYVAGAYVEIRRIAGTTTYQLWYNGSQVGTDQEITDAGIISNTLAGMFNTYSGNTLAAFSCVPNVDSRTTAWALAGGVSAANLVACYQPKGSASQSQSYINLATPGTNNAAPGTAPTFAAATGWTFDGLTQYLTTGIAPAAGWSLVVRYNNFSGGGWLIGVLSADANTGYGIAPNVSSTVRYYAPSETSKGPALLAGVLAMAGTKAYRNGTDEAVTLGNSTPGGNAYIGARLRMPSTAQSFGACNIQAVALYNSVLTADQVAAISTAMAAL